MARNNRESGFETLGYLAMVMGGTRPNKVENPHMTNEDMIAVFDGYDRARQSAIELCDAIETVFDGMMFPFTPLYLPDNRELLEMVRNQSFKDSNR